VGVKPQSFFSQNEEKLNTDFW